jgi:hypothetical protein
MMAYTAFGLLALLVLYLLARGFIAVPAPQLAHGLKTFAAAFTALAGTGLLFTGRVGLAFVTLAATAVAVRALLVGPRGADPLRGRPADESSVETEWLTMRLDHATGEVEGWVKQGSAAGRELASLGLGALLRLLAELQREDPPALPLLEAYLDRRFPDWRDGVGAEAGAGATNAPAVLDERTALEILGLAPGASEAEIKAAHRALMARLHPDHGGSAWLAAQLNQARDYLLRKR